MTQTDRLLEACDHGDEHALDQLGWRGVLDALRMWPRRLAVGDLAPYALALGDQDPGTIVAAIRTLATNQYRPSASQVLVAMRPPPAPARGERRGRPDLGSTALQAVRLAAAAGAEVCDCRPRTVDWHMDGDGVDWCPSCDGIEIGQYESAMESPSLGETAA